jgi:predicted MFS family arabinose efflux permease
VLRSRQFWVAALATAGLFGPFLAWTSGWAVPYLVSVVGLTTDQARLVIVGDGAAGVAGALLLGRLSDVLERRRLMMLFGGVLMTVAWGVLIILGSRGPAAVAVSMTLLVGFSFPTCNSSLVLAKESFRPDRAGSVLGLSNAASSIAAAVVGAVAGLALDAGWHGAFDNGIRAYPVAAYAAIPAVMLVASSLAVIGGLLVRETYGRQLEIPSPP